MTVAQVSAATIRPQQVPGQRRVDPDPGLPSPPTDVEKYSYLGRQHRWLLIVQAASFSMIAWSVMRFSTADLRLLLFLIPMTLYAVTLAVSLTSGTRRRRMSLAQHQALVSGWQSESAPSVDVFLPTAGEPLEILANTYHHVSRLAWAGEVTVWVLDDSARPEVKALADSYGLVYRTRPNRGELKKAGNLKYGYERSSADLILILDADFVPRPDMLKELVPYFDDPEIGIVQSPQFFDTRVRGMGWLQRSAGATQELFYRFIQPSRDRVNAAICVGTCAIYRRRALEAAGGFAQIGHSEDVHTGVKLMKAGFRLRYVPVVVAKGLCPDQLSAFVNQQYRWCTGSMSLLADKTFHESAGISRQQRLCFWAGFLYYLSTAVNSLVAPLPALAMLWMLPEWVEPMNSIWLLGALALWFVVLPLVMKGRWRFDVLRVQYLYSFAHLTAIVHLMRGRTRGWVATGATSTSTSSAPPLAVSLTRNLKTYVALTQLALWAGLARGVINHGIEHYWAMVVFAVLGSFIQVPLLFLRTGVKRRPAPQPATEQPAPAAVRIPQPRATAAVVAPSAATPAAPTPSGARQFRPDIQGLRAVAVTLVVLYHAHVPGISAGYVGVDVFFVISGFLITGQLMREIERTGRISLIRFYGGRIRRLLPPAAVVVIATVVAARFWDSIFHVRSVSVDALFTLVYGINYRLAALGVDYQNANGPESPLQHMWSLAVEEQFYVIWPLLLAFCALVGGRHRRALITTVLVLGAAASLYASVTVTVTNPPYAYFGIHTRAWELALGALVAMAATRLSRMPRGLVLVLSWSGLVVLVATAFVFTDDTPFPGTAALWPTVATAAIIAAGCGRSRGGAEAILGRRPFQLVGNFSYGWYLWHWPMVILIPLAMGYDLAWVYLLEISVLAFWFAVLTHYLVESPSRLSKLRLGTWLGGGLVVSGVTAAVVAVVITSLPAFTGTGAAAQAIKLDKSDMNSVRTALVDGLSVMEAPRNLQPAPADAASDQPVTSADGCHATYLQVDQPDCVFGDPAGKHTMVLFGDSHAQQWLPALDAQAKQQGWKVIAWTKAACPIADLTVFNDALGRDYTECDDWRERTVRKILKVYPDVLLTSQSDTVPGTQVGNTDWADSTATTLTRFLESKLPVTYVLDTPLPEQNVPECVATHLDNVGACNVRKDKTELYAGRMSSLDETLGPRGVTTMNPTRLFCTSQACPAVVGNILVYRDASHMSATYSDWLSPMTAPLFAVRQEQP
ncbi:membrane hypothetical protein [metagenome]|uniref:Uncharacterized protein n=1 Tax=metagenome TaxID=256318 RepID=A0A2P2BZT1_9ZZZZ